MGLKSCDIDYGTDGARELDERQNPLWHAFAKGGSNGGCSVGAGTNSGEIIANSHETNNKKFSSPQQNSANSGIEGFSSSDHNITVNFQ